MSKKDYELIAAALKSAYPKEAEFYSAAKLNAAIEAWHCVETAIAYTLATQNSRFNRERFLRAALPTAP